MKATLAVRCKEQINSVTADSDSTEITKKEDRNGYEIYEIAFSDLGENYVTVNYGEDKKSVLQYYATEPIETLIQSNTDFLVDKQQAKTEKGYNGAYLQWDMSTGKQISWDDYPGGGWKEWMAGGSDDLGLSPAVYLSEKNITAPQQDQIDSLEYYMENFIWDICSSMIPIRSTAGMTARMARQRTRAPGDPIIMCMWPIPITICTRSHSATLI